MHPAPLAREFVLMCVSPPPSWRKGIHPCAPSPIWHEKVLTYVT